MMMIAAIGLLLGQTPTSAADDRAPSPTVISIPAPVEVSPIKAVVSIAPLKGLLEPLLPKGSTIETLIPPGVSEHGYEIPPAKLALLHRADVVAMVGAGLEPQVEAFVKNNPSDARRVIVFSELVPIAPPAHTHAPGEPHGDGCSHANDPHVWLDPVHAQTFVKKIAESMVALRPVPEIDRARHPVTLALNSHLSALSSLDADFREAIRLVPKNRRTLVVAHDAYGWLARRYDLTIVPITGLNAGEPKPGDLKRAIETVKSRKVTTIFIEPQVSDAAAKRVAEATGASIATLDPLGTGDYFAFMRANLASILRSFGIDPNTTKPTDTKVESAP